MQRIGLGEGPDDGAKLQFDYAETDPSGRYGRFNEILGKGAMKRVYKAFDEVLGMEVAWNQVELNEVFRSPEELQRLYCEVHLLKNLNHDSIMRFHASWVDVQGRTFNFITEMFTSGTLREYRQKYKRLNIGAVKNWARQILRGLAYLHSHEPPVIHRDLKCDNIFVNGHLGQVKIGDLGLAAILQGSPHAHSVIGTPEFMAPEVYEEEYNELVDIYSFGMCVLEMLTSEYPYSECSNPAQIYKKVTSGKLPNAFYKIQNEEARQFVGKCLGNVSKRLPAEELLLDPFLALNERELLPNNPKNMHRALKTTNPPNNVLEDLLQPRPLIDPTRSTAMTITGTMNPAEDDTIFLRVQISEKLNGESRNIYFPFDVMNDTAGNVAMEMVKELEIKDWEPSEIALMIEKEISSLVPTWKEQDSFSYKEEAQHHPLCHLSLSSPSSSRASFPTPIRPAVDHVASNCYDWIQDTMFIDDDDATSRSSLNSYKYSSSNYCSGNDDDRYCDFEDSGPKTSGKPDHAIAKTHKTPTRFCWGESSSTAANNYNKQRGNCGLQNPRRLTRRIQSLLDVRSQLLHRSLVEEIHKRRLYKTVGAVENIGFQEPTAGETSKGFGW